ncbi:MAG TPA: hypothetical protein VGM50_12535 [Gemmatimonadaceae bacterium]|jgi:hypothetical protein
MTEQTKESRAVRTLRRSISRVAVEILVGFVGVYAAFALTAYKEHRDQIDRRHQIKRALIAEIRDIADQERKNAPGYQHALDVFDSSVKAGAPQLLAFTEADDTRGHVWEATKSAGALSIIDVPTFIALSHFYNDNSNMYAQYAQLRDITTREILPRRNQPASSFLDPRTKGVIPSLTVYRFGLARIAGYSDLVAREGDTLIKRLATDTL